MDRLQASTNPASGYEEACRRIEDLRSRDEDEIAPGARSIFLTHGGPSEKVVVLLHGYTNCPHQFERLAQALFERGYNVLAPRAPYHGYTDRMTAASARQTAEGLSSYLNEALDIAGGLGSRIETAGISMGGVLALWAACRRSDVDRAISISPALAFHALPLRYTALAGWLTRLTPNRFVWWDPERRENVAGPRYAYPRYSTKGLAHIVHMGTAIRRFAHASAPAARKVLFILNPADADIDNSFALKMYGDWRRLAGDRVGLYQFDEDFGLPHDLIDPEQPRQQTELVYPILMDLLTGPSAI